MKYRFFERPALVFSLAALSILTCLEAPLFISSFCLILWAWKWLSEMNAVSPLGRRTTSVLTILLVTLVWFQYRTLFDQESSSALLVSLTALKVMDYENQRDHLILALLGFLLLTLKPLYGLDLYWLPLQIVCMFGLWWALSQEPRKVPRAVLLSVFLSSLPIATALFLIFPRIVLPWALSNSKSKYATMGFSNNMNPGEVAELATSSELVFRARFFHSEKVEAESLYWKGGELTISEGLAWKKPQSRSLPLVSVNEPLSSDISYEVVLEPGAGSTIFTLDPTYQLKSTEIQPVQFAPFLWRSPMTTLKSTRYLGVARAAMGSSNPPGDQDLQIPELSPKAAEWVRQTNAKISDPLLRRRALKEFFARNNFVYTLNPGTYKATDLDEFLFERRRGFCEHFAGAYATMARALGIPTRVINGYQGAEFNPLGSFWRVTQRQAHAWVEIWNGAFWERLDPTQWATISEFNRQTQRSFFEWIDRSVDFYEAMNYRWTSFLLDFDQKEQSRVAREWLPRIFMSCILILAGLFIFRLIWSWFFSAENKTQSIRRLQLLQLVRQIKEAEEEFQRNDLSHFPPLKVLEMAEKDLPGTADFYRKVHSLYDRAVYLEQVEEESLKMELKELQRKWVEIQISRK
jgi:hypothetical protein